jgi:hypothetical protein
VRLAIRQRVGVSSAVRRLTAAGAGAAVLAVLAAGPSAAAGRSWVVAPLPAAKGTSLPNPPYNDDAEPGIGVGGNGSFWIGSDIDPNESGDGRTAAAVSGEDIWRSVDGGRRYTWMADPFNTVTGSQTPGLGGEDSDLAVAPARNSAGRYNVYATSLYLASSSVAISRDDGKSWTVDPLGGVPAEDRPWITSSGRCVFYLTYHQLPLFDPIVNRYDVCKPGEVGMGSALNPVQSTAIFASNSVPGLSNDFGKPVADNSSRSPDRGNLYVPMAACNLKDPADFINNAVITAQQVPLCPAGVHGQIEVAVSRDGGRTFSDYIVAPDTGSRELPVWAVTAAVDAVGDVYVAWSDNHHAYLSVSRDGGKTWTSPAGHRSPSFIRVDTQGTAVYPTVAAGRAGVVQVAYYGTSVSGDSNDQSKMGIAGSAKARARWHLYWASSRDAGRSFTVQRVSGINHTGVLCTQGSACPSGDGRDLLDDFGITISPTTGLTSIAFDADEPLRVRPAAHAIAPFTAYATELPRRRHRPRQRQR